METNDIRQKQKAEAIARMRALGLMPQVIKDFDKSGVIYYSERQNAFFNATLYWVSNSPTMTESVREFEDKHNALVYHCQLTHTEFGDMVSMLFVSEREEEWPMDRADIGDDMAFAWVENRDCPEFSEFGKIGIRPSMGGIARTW